MEYSSLQHCKEMSKEENILGPFDVNNGQDVLKGSGVYLTWEELWVTISTGNQKEGTKSILQGLSGYACPGEVLAIMGPSGCGKSTLLDSLAGRLSSRTRQKGEILINGQKQKLAYGTSAYVTQEDTLTWTLTVREAVYYSAQLQLPKTMSKSDKKEIAERTIREMGLQDSVDTRIGEWGRKGLSSGQRRRVSICIELLKRPKLLFLDEPTSGLDSAASYFDIEWGTGNKFVAEEVIDRLIRSYSLSDACKQMKTLVLEIRKREGGPTEKKERQANLFTQCLILTKRSFINMYRDLGYYWLRLAIYVALGLGLGSVFYDLGSNYNSIHERGSLLMFVASLLTIMAIGGFPSFVEDLKVFRRERLNGHYGATTFVVGNTFSSTPFLLLISTIPVQSLISSRPSSRQPRILVLHLPNDLPKIFWKYPMYYIAFHKYAYQGLYKNEFEGRRFSIDQLGGPSTVDGETILRDIWQVEMGYSKWIDLGILFGMVVVYRVIFFVVVKIGEKMNSVRDFSLSSLEPEDQGNS
ncbi:hypothetical protein DH2020_030821 [Rehmannia glutinosa]|uniref:ABC transporter domain-containing protein n=1 Tax=Rehmannia glutinosa TaxID=99300 RepID=A0ABR0VJR2_REHGL